jgi:uncharacterized protein involved in type VI secretion and phage assembly
MSMSLYDAISDPDEAVQAGRRVSGVALGIISDNRDPDGLARVKVRMPWLAPDAESDWIQIATLYAGGGRGSVWLPEVDDQVLLAFEHGDINSPYVIGALWNRQAKPPEANAGGHNDIKIIRSRSGHSVTFCDDGPNRRERVEIRSKGGHRIELSDAEGAETVTVSDRSGGNVLTLETLANRATLKAGATITIQAPEVAIVTERFTVTAETTYVECAVSNVVGAVLIDGDTNVAGALTVELEANVAGALTVEGATNIAGALSVELEANVAGALTVEGLIVGIVVPPV